MRFPSSRWMVLALALALVAGVGVAAGGRAATPQATPLVSTHLYLPLIKVGDWFTNIADGDHVARTITALGSYPAAPAGNLWIFVIAPNGRYYPQSEDACGGRPTPQINGRWEMRVGLGDAANVGLAFKILPTIANAAASQSLLDTLRAWCGANNYPGLLALPAGVAPLNQISVIRTADLWGPAPPISNTHLAGQIAITSPHQSDAVPPSQTIRGTYSSDATSALWVLIYATNGRWYPQSKDACHHQGTQRANGEWQVPAIFGRDQNSGEPFDIVALLATPQADAAFDQKQKEWCDANNYPGWLTIELPQGIDEKARIRVTRS